MREAIGLALEIFGPAALAGAAVSSAIVWLIRQALPAAAKDRFSLPAGMSIGFFAGYVALRQEWAALVPKQSWQWLPYLGVAIACIMVVRLGARYERALRWLRLLGAAIMASSALTPTWQIFGVSWPLSIGFAIGYLLLVAGPLESMPARLVGRTLFGFMTLAAVLSAAAIGAEVSVRYAQLAGIAAASLGGASLATIRGANARESAIRALIPVFAVLVGGIAFVAAVEPEKPLVCLLLPPLVPAVLWIGAVALRSRGRLSLK